jgi:hypothetical protein
MYYAIVKFDDSGNHELLDGYDEYDLADAQLDYYCDKYPSAAVDIVEMG